MGLGRRLLSLALGCAVIVGLAASAGAQAPRPPSALPSAAPPAAPPPAAQPQRPAALKTFQRPDLVESARRTERTVRRDAEPLAKPAAQVRRDADAALQKNDARTAVALYASLAAAAPSDAAVWLRLARAVAAIRPNADESRSTLLDEALGAAFIAYRRSATRAEEGEALALIGRLYADRTLWRAAMVTLAAALDARDNPADRAFLDKLKAEHGFRMLDYTVESDLAAPRACVQFSEEVRTRGVDLAAFVEVDGMDRPAVTGEEQQICVEGLKHGTRYTVRLRPGIPATTGETLRAPAELTLYVRDRTPSVRFTGRAYVLPSTGQRGLPVISVNTRAVKVNVLRIGDRALVPTALQGEFRNAIESYTRETLAEGRALPVFSGTLEVDAPLNEDVTTAIPVAEAVGKLESGVYVMTASPADAQTEYGEGEATQWFIVSDLGLTAVSAADGVHVLVRALGSAAPVEKTELRLIARSNEVLGTVATDAAGYARFDAGLSRGAAGLAPEAVIARAPNGDYAFLSLKDAGFDLTDRGVAGREAPGALDAFLATERGVYRSGESVQVTALLRDAVGNAVPDLPLTFILQRPDGVEDRRLTAGDMGAGGRTLTLPLLAGAMTGTWHLKAHADAKAPPIGEVAFLVEDYMPDRVEFDLTPRSPALARGRPAEIAITGRYLFGAPAAGLDVEAEASVRLAPGRPAFPGYAFGDADDTHFPTREPVADTPRTDANGRATLRLVPPTLPDTARPLEVEALVRVVEPGGRAVQRTLVLPVAAAGAGIGVKPLFASPLGEGQPARFDVIVAGSDDTALARAGVRWRLSRIETRFQWYKAHGIWDYEPVKTVRRMGEGVIDVTAADPFRLEVPTEYGRYRLELSADGLPVTAVTFEAGFSGTAAADTPDRLDLTLDRSAYAAGDTLEATVTSRAAGTATLLVVNGAVLDRKVVDLSPGATKVRFTVAEGWGPGAYVLAFSHRPLDAAASRMPGRAVGVAWFSVDRARRTLGVALAPVAQMRPGGPLAVPVSLTGLKPGAKAFVTVAAVDVGILNLTRFQPPAPEAAILGQRRLAAEVRDLYGALIDGMQGNVGRLRSGGDGGEIELQASPPSQPPLALFSGIVPVGPDGKAEVSFDIPPFDGTVRVMAMAWSADGLGHAATDVVVRDPVVVLATLPRFLAAGDRSSLALDLANVAGPAGDYRLEVTAEGAVTSDATPGPLTLAAGQRQSFRLPIAGRAPGDGAVVVRVSGQGLVIERRFALKVRPAYPEISRRTVRTLKPGESLTLSADLFADLVPGHGGVALSVTPATSTLDVPALLAALDRYPYGCTEQVVSRALPLLYYNDVAALVGRPRDADADARLADSVTRLMARQGSDGSFGLWTAGGEDVWLDAYVVDFLTRAREKGLAVPDAAFRLALDRLRNAVSLSGDELRNDEGLAYALYVLARNGRAPVGDLRYIADTRLKDISTPLGRGQIGAALALLGDRTRAERVFSVALDAMPAAPAAIEPGRGDFGSALRDAAALSVLAREAELPRLADVALARVDAARTRTQRTSTQENAWLILAARALSESARTLPLEVDGAASTGALGRRFTRADLAGRTFTVRNTGREPVTAVVAIDGPPLAPEPETAQGFTLSRAVFTLDGRPADLGRATQNQRFVVVLKAQEAQPALAEVLLVDFLPAGFEIENPRLIEGGEDGSFAWLGETTEIPHMEFRDDRMVAAVTRQEEDDSEMVVAYVVRAVSPGRYAHPPAMVEDMYRPDRFARTAAGTLEVAPAR